MLTRNKIVLKKVVKTSQFDIPYYVTDNSKIVKFYKWKPTNSLDKILKDIYIWLLQNKSVWKYFK